MTNPHDPDISFTLAELLRAYRDGVQWSQDDLARAARVSQKSISDIETGSIKHPQDGTLMKLAAAIANEAAIPSTKIFAHLKAAKENQPHPPGVSAFAFKLDALMAADSPAFRLIFEASVLGLYAAMKEGWNQARDITKKRRNSS
jgi:transcriptional regulator with XRE-family HTH domain